MFAARGPSMLVRAGVRARRPVLQRCLSSKPDPPRSDDDDPWQADSIPPLEKTHPTAAAAAPRPKPVDTTRPTRGVDRAPLLPLLIDRRAWRSSRDAVRERGIMVPQRRSSRGGGVPGPLGKPSAAS